MTRLTTHIRDQIVANAQIKSGNRARRDATQEKRKEWADAVRVTAIGSRATELDAIAAKVEALRLLVPEEFRGDGTVIISRGHLNLNCAGITLRVSEWEGSKVSPSSFTLLADNPLVQEFHEICAQEKANAESWEQVKTNVYAAVKSVTTVARLLKIWPEVKELLPAYVEESKDQLPAIQVSDLNALVGLPSAE